MIELQNLKEKLTDYFVEIVDIINKLVDLRSENFASMLEINSYLEDSAHRFMNNTAEITGNISSALDKKVDNLDVEAMKDEIVESTNTFLRITDDLELLSYNTICRTMSLGNKGATIAHISKEIKKNSNSAKDLLGDISETFGSIYEDFKKISETFAENSVKVDTLTVDEDDDGESLEVSSDISRLIEFSQFHDIIVQEIEAIERAFAEAEEDDNFSLGKRYGVFEIACQRISQVRERTLNTFEEIKSVTSEFLYHINTDIQNIVSRANIVRMEFDKAREYSESIETIVEDLVEMIDSTDSQIRDANQGIHHLKKFGKSFRNLVVITSVEVSRIGDESLQSVVVSMNDTEQVLSQLVSKLASSLKVWEELKEDFGDVLTSAEGDIKKLRNLHREGEIDDLAVKADKLDDELSYFRSRFSGSDFMEHLQEAISSVNLLFDDLDKTIERNFDEYKTALSSASMNSAEFEEGRQSAEIIDIIADSSDHSSVEFF
ncbi:hypothetical protein [Limisalsivibrio acetivorans]|uniref:hypothetical protein n=1 Tax=Limisalsivibrio acetivorans TaxID=1304888 RepID=UPI0003B37E79|nr:hypothetical protein [Limisalsivibrio acetivorans]